MSQIFSKLAKGGAELSHKAVTPQNVHICPKSALLCNPVTIGDLGPSNARAGKQAGKQGRSHSEFWSFSV